MFVFALLEFFIDENCVDDVEDVSSDAHYADVFENVN